MSTELELRSANVTNDSTWKASDNMFIELGTQMVPVRGFEVSLERIMDVRSLETNPEILLHRASQE